MQKLGWIEGPRGYHGRPRRKAPHLGEDEITDLPLLLLCDGGGGSTRSLPPRGPHRENESHRPDRLVLGHAIPGSEQGTEGLPREISPPLFAKKRRAYYGRQGSAVGGGARRHRIGGTGGEGRFRWRCGLSSNKNPSIIMSTREAERRRDLYDGVRKSVHIPISPVTRYVNARWKYIRSHIHRINVCNQYVMATR